jgi:hypothetical protein
MTQVAKQRCGHGGHFRGDDEMAAAGVGCTFPLANSHLQFTFPLHSEAAMGRDASSKQTINVFFSNRKPV